MALLSQMPLIRENSGCFLLLYIPKHTLDNLNFCGNHVLFSSCSNQINSLHPGNTMDAFNLPLWSDLDSALVCACAHLGCRQVQVHLRTVCVCLCVTLCSFFPQFHPVSDHSWWFWLQLHWQCQQGPWAYLFCHLCVLCFLCASGKQQSPPCPCIESSVWETLLTIPGLGANA